MSFYKKAIVTLLLCSLVLPCFARSVKIKARFTRQKTIPFIPILADISDNARTLTLQFLESMDGVVVEVTDKNGNIVFSDILYAGITEAHLISLANEEAGTYELTIVPQNQDGYIGEFEIY